MRSLLQDLTILCLVSAPAAAAPVLPQDAEVARLPKLLEAHARWRGGREALGKLADLAGTGTLEAARLRGTIRIEQTRAGQSRVDIDLKDLKETEIAGLDGGFKINVSGQVEPLPAAEQARALFLQLGTFGLDLAPQDLKTTLRAREEKDGRTWEVVRLERGPVSQDLLLDPADGSLTWMREQRDHDEVWTRLSDWRVVAGVRFGFRQETFHKEAKENATVAWQELRVNAGIERSRFARPARQTGVALFTGATKSTGWLPMELYLNRYIYLRGRLNGTETDIVLDSGAGVTVIDTALADELKLEARGDVVAKGVGGTQKAAMLGEVAIEFGTLALRGIKPARIDMSGVGTLLGRTMPVILGKEVFHEVVIDVDYPGSRIAFHSAEGFAYRGAGHTLPLFPGPDGHRRVEIGVDGKATALVTVDTGSGGSVTLFKGFTERNKLLESRRASEARLGGVGGAILAKIATLESLTFAGYRLSNVPATFTTDAKSTFGSREIDGNLGAAVFCRFRMIFDYSREQLHVEPGPDWDKTPFRRDRVGLNAVWSDGALEVKFVAPGSPAEQAGVTAGEKITALAGKPLSAEGWRAQLMQWAEADPGVEVTWTCADGKERRLKAADYY